MWLKEKSRWSKQWPIEVEGKVLVGSLKESATVLWQAEEEGEMLEDIQGLFHPFECQSPSYPRYLFLPPLTPILSPLIRKLRLADGFTTLFIGLPLTAVPEEALHHLQRLRNTLAEKSGQDSKGTRASFAERAFYQNYHWPTPAAIKAMPNYLISSVAVRTELYPGKVIIFSLFSIILDRDAKIVYDHPCLDRALEGILWRISASNPDHPSRAFLFIADLSD